jgi:F-type H+-transporting ATPase subunit b
MKLDAWTLLWQVINLVVLLGLLRWLLFKPLLAVIGKRQAAVAAVAQQAAAAAQAAQQALASATAERAAVESTRAKVLADAQLQARHSLDMAKEEAAASVAGALGAARQRLAQERKDAARELSVQGATLATDLASRLLQQAAGEQADRGFIDKLLAQLEATAPAERAAWWPAEGPPVLTLATAHAVPLAEQTALAQRLRGVLGPELVLTWGVEPALLAGAELRFAHGVLALHWAAELKAARAQMVASP